jgi:hypothetical protein
MAMAFRYFESFVSKGLKFCNLNEAICEDFRSYLWSRPVISFREKPITRNTAANYFAKFRSALKEVSVRDYSQKIFIYAAFGGQAPNSHAELL